jgi:EH domain-containing protein 1
MPNVFRSVLKLYNLAPGDFPELKNFQSICREQDFSKFPSLRQSMIDSIEAVISIDIPRLMDALPRSLDPDRSTTVVVAPPQQLRNLPNTSSQSTRNLAPPISAPPPPPEEQYFETAKSEPNPFEEAPAEVWGLQEYIPMYEQKFIEIQQGGFVTGSAAKSVLMASGLPNKSLRVIWDLSDYGKDGKLDLYEFVIAMFLSDMVKAGHEVPAQLDPVMIPPSALK